jgi:hypothetical protein
MSQRDHARPSPFSSAWDASRILVRAIIAVRLADRISLLRSLFRFFQWADRGSPPIVTLAASGGHELQLAGSHGWVAAATTEVCPRTILE